jgi:2-polyprenyl-6-methoxyphenol hydroxylase-like FAD-dependent oxidoreductase
MTHIGIIGAGIAGLQLGLLLRSRGIEATIYTEKTPEQQRAARLTNIVVRNAPTRERERILGVDHWDSAAPELIRITYRIRSARPLTLACDLKQPANIVDMRIYLARLLEDFAARGGRVVLGTLQTSDLADLSTQHDLLVIAAGRGGMTTLFPRLPEHSPYSTPQRVIIGGLYKGIAYPEPLGFEVYITPGTGEILSLPLCSFEPGLTGIAFEMAPGGGFEPLKQLRYEHDSQRFDTLVRDLLREYAPALYARLDPQAFELARPLDLCHIAITPTVRRGYTRLQNGRLVVALGDAHVVNDPLIGQGANAASHAAWVLGQAISSAGDFDEAFCRQVEQQMWTYTGPATELCNARLRPPAPHAAQLLGAAAQHKAIANMYGEAFHNPAHFWEIVSSPERTAALIEQFANPGVMAVGSSN